LKEEKYRLMKDAITNNFAKKAYRAIMVVLLRLYIRRL
jgi:hypothetical protein